MRHLGVRWKVLAVLTLPVVALGITVGALTTQAASDARSAHQAGRLAAAGDQVGRLVAALQAERAAAVAVAGGDDASARRLPALEAATGAATRDLLGSMREADAGAVSAAVSDTLRAAAAVPATLAPLRARLAHAGGAGGSAPTADEVRAPYDHLLDVVVGLPARIAADLPQRDLARSLAVAADLAAAAEAVASEQLVGDRLVSVAAHPAAGDRPAALQQALAVAEDRRSAALADVRSLAGTTELTALDDAQASGPDRFTALAQRLQSAPTPRAAGVGRADWDAAATSAQAGLWRVAHLVAADGEASSQVAVDAAQQRMLLTLAAAVALFGVSVLFALMTSRRITAPLRRLTADVDALAGELPELVDRVASGEQVPAPELAVTTKDEVGTLARAFHAVHTTTLDVAGDQARLRAAIADMFVNVARRNQVLLSRLLSLIDSLERDEQDPDALENLFRLDHLATRMRRNAESLLVLAGTDGGRRLRAPMPLTDVVRTATGEIEHYDRVVVDLAEDPPVVAHLALPLAHLVAELVENATQFSDPASRVTVTSVRTREGVRLAVCDRGLGMTTAELAAANATIAQPAVTEAFGAQRLGFFVVGRLAVRLGVRVRLEPNPSGGTVAAVDLPPVVFAGGTVTELPRAAHVDVTVLERAQAGTAEPVADEPVDDGPAGEPAGSAAEVPAGEPAPTRRSRRLERRKAPRHSAEPTRAERRAEEKAFKDGTLPPFLPPEDDAPDPFDAPPAPRSRPVVLADVPQDSAVPDALEALRSAAPVEPPSSDVLPTRGGLRRSRRRDGAAPGPGEAAAFPLPPAPRREQRRGGGVVLDAEEERLRHALASEALSELSRLSSYRPDTVAATAGDPLTRRTPAGRAPGAEPVALAEPVPPAAQTPAVRVPAARPPSEPADAPPTDGLAPHLSPQPPRDLPPRPPRDAPRVPVHVAPVEAMTVLPGAALTPDGRRDRSAQGVRATLSGLQAGVRRGRSAGRSSPAGSPANRNSPTSPTTPGGRP